MRSDFRVFLAGILFLSITNTAEAQWTQYTLPGGPSDRPGQRQEEFEKEIEEARYHLGPVRIAPWISLRNAAYVRSLYSTGSEPPADWTATVGAGFRAYLRTGRKVTWTVAALPEYVWWKEQADRRRVNGRYGLGIHGFFNRLSVEVMADREEQQQIVTPEIPELANARTDSFRLLSEVKLTGAISAFAVGSLTEQTALDDDLPDSRVDQISLLDREDRSARVGLRWRPREPWMFGVGVERTSSDFAEGALDRSNEGSSPVLEARYERRRITVEADLAARSLEAREGAAFVAFEDVTGRASVQWMAAGGLSFSVYGNRDLLYSLSPGYAYLSDERVGVAVLLEVIRQAQLRVFAETGTYDYTAFSPAAAPRREDVDSFGGQVTVNVWRSVNLEISAVRSEFDSNLPGADRSYTSVGTTVSLLGGR
ncbi:MAG TPA: hypothetical protein VLT87_01960 [Thermoanaerobaculia bacterium]|nr:hypothetical protein [Thermoanaerobaculia bacterium]